MRRRVAAGGVAVIVIGWLLLPPPYENPAPMPFAERADPGDAPNVVLVIGCTVRRDQLTPYGGPPTLTPFLSELAAKGAQFDDAIAASSWTKASTVAMITGQHAITVGMVEPGHHRNERALYAGITTLAEYFAEAGYETVGATANPNLNTVFGMAQGFDGYRDADERIIDEKIAGAELVTRTLALVNARKDPDRPLFVRAMFVDTHVPRDLPSEDIKEFRGDGVDRMLAEYRAQLHRFDTALRTLDEGLRQWGLTDDNTLWVMVSDHGEGMGKPDHHWGHGRTLYGSMIRVPWIIKGPGVLPGTKVLGLASLIDLPKTVLGLVGVDGPDHGEDWSPQVRGETPSTTRKLVYSDTWFYEARRSAVWSSSQACQRDFGTTGEPRDGIVFEDACFVRKRDPDFIEPAATTALMGTLEGWHSARVAEAESFEFTSNATVTSELSRQLEALGYTD